ncbi:hypothetical protein MLD38_014933 [Melastoma candidum]|uniref:Uncharacterized protein n=1 Tax=Melastoma candidum TaxID=119954 RepID=A0ACB9RFK5_9MYRT|nr:hypothetical protein MLD38_014933 [Melastoma candidum]
MSALRFSICLHATDSKRLRLSWDREQFPDRRSVTRAVSEAGLLSAIRFVRVCSFSTDVNGDLSVHVDGRGHLGENRAVEECRDSGSNVRTSPEGRTLRRGARPVGKAKSAAFRKAWSGKDDSDAAVSGDEVDVDNIRPSLGVEECNAILRRLEKDSDARALRFFEWMRCNGKLRGNVVAYSLVLRVFSRREDWDVAEKLIQEMRCDPHCELNYRVFNTLIYTCSKKGRVEMGMKWFRMMLENEVEPNVATFGMLATLCQKRWKVEDGEFLFCEMRKMGIKCHSAYSAMITIYTRMKLFDKAEEVIGIMRGDNVMPTLETWLVMLNAYCQQGKLDVAEKILVRMKEAGVPLNIVAYNTLITGYGRVSNMEAAQRIFENLADAGLEPDETTYRSMIEGWGRADGYHEATWYYKQLKELGMRPNSSNLFTLINVQAKYGSDDDAAEIIDDMLNLGCQHSSIISVLLQAYERAGRIVRVPFLLKGSFYQKVLANQASCSTLVMAYVENGLVAEAIRVLLEKHWRDQAFEDNLYHLLICSCKELGRFEDAIKLYKSMPNLDSKLNIHIASTMIDIYSITGQLSSGEELYTRLKSSKVSLDLVAFSVVIRMYMKAGYLESARDVIETMDRQENVVPDVFLIRDMLRIYQRLGSSEKLEGLYYKILKRGVTWDKEMYDCVINCCARALPVDELSRLFDEMHQRGFPPNINTVNVMLDVYGNSKLFKKVRKLYSMARKQGTVDVITYNTVIASYGKVKDFESMSKTIQEMQLDGFSISLEAYNCMLDAYGKEGRMECFRRFLKNLKESTHVPDLYTYNIMMNIYGENGSTDEVATVLAELKEQGTGPDLCSYNTLIKAYGIAGMVDDAMNLVKEMRDKGIKPDKITYANLVNVLRRNDKFLEAVRWSLWMKQMGI